MTSLSLTNLDPYAKRLTALANKAGAGLPTTKITAKTWNTVLDAALDRLEASVAAPAVIIPTTTEPATAPTTVVYGPKKALALNIAEDAAKIPGLAYVDHNSGFAFVNQSGVFDAIEWSGYTLMIDGDVQVTVSNGRFSRTQRQPLIAIGWNDALKSPAVILRDVEASHPQIEKIAAQVAITLSRGRLTLAGSYLHDCSGTVVAAGNCDQLLVDGNRFGAAGKGAYVDPLDFHNNTHVSHVQLAGGEGLIARNRFDCSDHAGLVPVGALTSVIHGQARNAPVRLRIEDNDVLGLEGYPLYNPLVMDKNVHGVTTEIIGNRLARPTYFGAGGYIENNGAAVTATGNTDALSRASIDALLAA